MDSLDIQGTVTERSNGVIRITPATGAPAARVEIHEAALGSSQLPAMGDEVTVTIKATEKVAAIEARQPEAIRAASTPPTATTKKNR